MLPSHIPRPPQRLPLSWVLVNLCLLFFVFNICIILKPHSGLFHVVLNFVYSVWCSLSVFHLKVYSLNKICNFLAMFCQFFVPLPFSSWQRICHIIDCLPSSHRPLMLCPFFFSFFFLILDVFMLTDLFFWCNLLSVFQILYFSSLEIPSGSF